MFKKSIYLLTALLIGAFIVFQSCNQNNPITQQESPSNSPVVNGNGENEDNMTGPNSFFGAGIGFPQRCPCGPERLQLWAEDCGGCGKTLVGYIEFLNRTQTSMTVKYVTNVSPWIITCIRFHLATHLSGIPVKTNHDPDPNNYQYKFDFPESEARTSYSFPITFPSGNCDPNGYYIAGEACVCRAGGGGVQGLMPLLPQGYINMCVNAKEDGCGYWRFTINGAASSIFNGQFCGWCIDPHTEGVPPGQCDSVKIFSSYDSLIMSHFDEDCGILYPQNLKRVNWILNHFTAGVTMVDQYDYTAATWSIPPDLSKFVPYGTQGVVSTGDIQYAIWMLLDNATGVAIGSTSKNIWGLLHAAYTNSAAVNFTPVCGQVALIIVVPKDNPNVPPPNDCYQPVGYVVPVPCGSTCCTVSWADGKNGARFPWSHMWGTYFRWGINCHSIHEEEHHGEDH